MYNLYPLFFHLPAQATGDKIDRDCGSPLHPSGRIVDTRYFPAATMPTTDLILWLRDNGFTKTGSAPDLEEDAAAIMALREPPWDRTCAYSRSEVLAIGHRAQRRGFAAVLAVAGFQLSFLLATAAFIRFFYRRRANVRDHETESRGCANFFASYLIAVAVALGVTSGMQLLVRHYWLSIDGAVSAGCGDAETNYLLTDLVEQMKSPTLFLFWMQGILLIPLAYQLFVLGKDKCQWRTASKYL